MTIKVILRKKEYELNKSMSVNKIYKRLSISPESYLAVRDGKLLTENDIVNDGDTIKIIAVISGG